MKRIIVVCVMALWVGVVLAGHASGEVKPDTQPEGDMPEGETQAAKRFPIVTRLEMERAYGFFIGDEIPLTLEIEIESGVVLDLVNLPREGEQHGAFEVRRFHLTSTEQPDARRLFHHRTH